MQQKYLSVGGEGWSISLAVDKPPRECQERVLPTVPLFTQNIAVTSN